VVINSAILGTDGWDDTKVVDIAGADALNNTFFSTHYSEKDAEVQGFQPGGGEPMQHNPLFLQCCRDR